jgi:LPS-assembly lipoprotein
VLSETREKQILSLNSQGRVREYKLLYNFRFRVRTPDGKEYLDTVTVQLKRTITFNEAQVRRKNPKKPYCTAICK